MRPDRPMLSKKALAVMLSRLKPFRNPKRRDEQYATDPEIAATMLWMAYMAGDIEGKAVLDPGAGTGILGIGALALGAEKVIFIEKDAAAVSVLKENLEERGGAETIKATIETGTTLPKADTCIMNPPFGTQERHADTLFLEKAFAAAKVVYAIHKTATVPFLKRFAGKNGWTVAEVQDLSYPLKRTMKEHKKELARIATSIVVYRGQGGKAY